MRAKRFAAAAIAASLLIAGACGDNPTERTPGDLSQEKPLAADVVTNPLRKLNFIAAYANMSDAYKHLWQTGDVMSASIAGQKNLGESQGAGQNLRASLSELLGEHALVAAIATQKITEGAGDSEGAVGQLDKNSDALGDAIAAALGEDVKAAFLKPWKDHIRMFADYASATLQGEPTKKAQAAGELDAYTKSFGETLGGATGLPAATVTEALKAHVNYLVTAIESYRAKEYVKSYTAIHDAYTHMQGVAAALSASIASQKGLGETTGKAVDLRMSLGSAMGEHGVLAAYGMQKALDGAGDFVQLTDGLEANANTLGGVLGGVYGDGVKNEFLKQWKEHNRMLLDFAVATKENNGSKINASKAELEAFTKAFGEYMGKTTGVSGQVLADSFKLNFEQLERALEEYAGKV